jgi:selenocysteine-specific elongation factor
LAADPFDPLDPKELGLGTKHLAAAAAAGRLLLLDGHPLLPSGPAVAATRLAACDPPFTVAQARQALNARRPLTVALLEHLDLQGVTRRLPGGLRELSAPRAASPTEL